MLALRLLLLEDDAKLARTLRQLFTEEGYVVDVCATGPDAVASASLAEYSLLILDWMVPDMDGVAACRELRRRGLTVPILMLTARGATAERVLGLDAGADDYLTKPFDMDELLARARALVRRSAGIASLRCGDLELDRLTRRVSIGGRELDLTERELAVLTWLALRADKVVTRSEILARVWSGKYDPDSNLVEVHVSHLREKLGPHKWMIETVRGRGYRLRSSKAP